MQRAMKKLTALGLAAAMAFTGAATGASLSSVDAQAATKVYQVKSEKNSDGDSIKYTYNKKGLVTKAVSKYSEKYDGSESTTKETTTYKYNKKNKVKTETTKTVTKTTYYETDKTTGLQRVGTRGTITTTTTDTTKYTYNKKGAAKKAVTTTTIVKSGSRTDTDYDTAVSSTQLDDGTYIADYNHFNADGTVAADETKANAYFYVGDVDKAQETVTTTIDYTANKDGTYTATTTEETSDLNYTKTYNITTYRMTSTDGGATYSAPVAVSTQDVSGDDYNSYTYHTYYMSDPTTDADGNYYKEFGVINYITLTVTDASVDNWAETTKTTSVITDKEKATVKYTNDKKKRVKKAVTTAVSTDKVDKTTEETLVISETDATAGTSNSTTWVENSRTVTESTDTSTYTTKYSYGKNGYLKKAVVTDKGVADSAETISTYPTTTTVTGSKTTADGTTTISGSMTYETTDPTTVVSTVSKDGVETTTTTSNPYTEKISVTEASASGTDTYNGTVVKSYYSNGGYKTVTTDVETVNGATTSTANTSYVFDRARNATATVYTDETGAVTYSYNDVTTRNATGDTAKAKIDAAVAAAGAEGSYAKVKTKTVLAEPYKEVYTYKYDKNNNLKSYKVKGNYNETVYVKNETYGNTIYTYDADGEVIEKEQTVKHTGKEKYTYDTEVKEGTSSLTKQLVMYDATWDRYTVNGSGYYLDGRTTYKLKVKKVKDALADQVELQQWILQNGVDLTGKIGTL